MGTGPTVSLNFASTASASRPSTQNRKRAFPPNSSWRRLVSGRRGRGSYTLTTQSLSHNSNGINNTRALLLLPIIMGYIDIPGGVPFNKGPKNLGNPSSGIHPDMKDAAWWNDKKRRLTRYDAKNVPLWNDMKDAVSPNLLPEWVEKGMIKAFAGFGFNVNIWPQPAEYRKAFESWNSALPATCSIVPTVMTCSTSSCRPR